MTSESLYGSLKILLIFTFSYTNLEPEAFLFKTFARAINNG